MTWFSKLAGVVGMGLILTLLGCGNPFDEMASEYQKGHYLKAAKKAIEGLRKDDLRPKVIEFLDANGENLVNKSLLRGQHLMKYPTEQPIRYWASLISVFEEMQLLDLNIANLDHALDQANTFKTESVNQYVQNQYIKGQDAYKKRLYRKSLNYFKSVQAYKTGYRDVTQIVEKATARSRRHISISPFYKPANLVTQFLGDTFANIITGGRHNAGNLAIRLELHGIDVASQFNGSILNQLNNRKSSFIHVSLDDPDDDIDHTQYYCDGIIDATETLTQTEITKNGDPYIRADYEILVTVESGVFITQNDEEVTRISFSESASVRKEFPGATVGALPKTDIVYAAIRNASNRFVKELLAVVDKDLDPYLYYLDRKTP